MEVETQLLTYCEIAPGGDVISLGLVNSNGEPQTIHLTLNQLGALAMTLPGLIGIGTADALWRSELAVCLSIGVLGRRTVHRSHSRHGYTADDRWLYRLFLPPARTTEPARRGAGQPLRTENDACKLILRPTSR
jgi:hypothetical protein